MYQRILVAIDATSESTEVLQHAGELASSTGATVRVLHVRTVDVVDGGGLGGLVEEEDTGEAAKVVGDAVYRLRAAGVARVDGWTGETVRGDVPNAVLDQARDFKADLLVLGARRHGSLATLFLGSVSDAVVHRAPCPVLLVP